MANYALLADEAIHSLAGGVKVFVGQRAEGFSVDLCWTTACRQKADVNGHEGVKAGPWIQVSRLGNPLVNEVLIPMSMKDH